MDTLDTMESGKLSLWLSLKLILPISTVDCTGIMDMLDIHTHMDTWDIMESVKLKLILPISTVDCTDIMDMLDIPTHMDTWDTMGSVKLKLILLIYMEVSMDTMAMLAIPTLMDTSDTMDKHEHHQMKLPLKTETNHSLLSSLVTTMFQCLMYSW